MNCLKLYTSSVLLIATLFMGCTTIYTHPKKNYEQTTQELNDCAIEAKWRCEEMSATKMPTTIEASTGGSHESEGCVNKLTNQCMTEGLGYQRKEATFGIITENEPNITTTNSN